SSAEVFKWFRVATDQPPARQLQGRQEHRGGPSHAKLEYQPGLQAVGEREQCPVMLVQRAFFSEHRGVDLIDPHHCTPGRELRCESSCCRVPSLDYGNATGI